MFVNLQEKFFKAVQTGNESAVISMLEKPFDHNCKDKYGRPALQYAAIRGNTGIFRTLLEGGLDINARDKNGFTALYAATVNGHAEIVRLLLDAGADRGIAYPTKHGAMSVAHLAAKAGHTKIVAMYLNDGVSTESKNDRGFTLLHEAAEQGNQDVIDLLLKAGAEINAASGITSSTPLHIAIKNGHFDSVQALLSSGADIEKKDGYGQTPLHVAASEGFTIEPLVTSGATLDACDGSGRTPLHCAAIHDAWRAAQVLIENDANLEAKDKEARTALMLAKSSNSTSVYKLLITAMRKADYGWKKLADDEIVLTRSLHGHELREVFNFTALERVTFSCNLNTEAESLFREPFFAMNQMDVQKAATELQSRGGNDYTGAVHKQKHHLKIG